VVIPDRIQGRPVTSIGKYAFWENRITSVTIGANVRIESAFHDYFEEFYDAQGKKAGVYTYRNNAWSYSPR
jgi:hypothetical protein